MEVKCSARCVGLLSLSAETSEALLFSSTLSPSSAAPATLTYYSPTSATGTKDEQASSLWSMSTHHFVKLSDFLILTQSNVVHLKYETKI